MIELFAKENGIKNFVDGQYYNIVRVESGNSIWYKDYKVTFELVSVSGPRWKEITIAVITHNHGDIYTLKNWAQNQPANFNQVQGREWINAITGQPAQVINSIPISSLDVIDMPENVNRMTLIATEYFTHELFSYDYFQLRIASIVTGRTDRRVMIDMISAYLIKYCEKNYDQAFSYMAEFLIEALWHMVKSIDWQYVSERLLNLYETLPTKEEAQC